MAFKKYVELWEEGKELVELKKQMRNLPSLPNETKGIVKPC